MAKNVTEVKFQARVADRALVPPISRGRAVRPGRVTISPHAIAVRMAAPDHLEQQERRQAGRLFQTIQVPRASSWKLPPASHRADAPWPAARSRLRRVPIAARKLLVAGYHALEEDHRGFILEMPGKGIAMNRNRPRRCGSARSLRLRRRAKAISAHATTTVFWPNCR
jgi:hypothetical protein